MQRSCQTLWVFSSRILTDTHFENLHVYCVHAHHETYECIRNGGLTVQDPACCCGGSFLVLISAPRDMRWGLLTLRVRRSSSSCSVAIFALDIVDGGEGVGETISQELHNSFFSHQSPILQGSKLVSSCVSGAYLLTICDRVAISSVTLIKKTRKSLILTIFYKVLNRPKRT